MSDKIYEVPADWTKRAFINESQYRKMYERSLADPTNTGRCMSDRLPIRTDFGPSRPSVFIG